MEASANSYIILISFVSLFTTGDNLDLNRDSSTVFQEAKNKFNRLLNAIANTNEKRLDALKKYTELEWHNPSNRILRYIEDENREYFDEILQFNHELTKKTIGEVLHNMICRHDSNKPTQTKEHDQDHFKNINGKRSDLRHDAENSPSHKTSRSSIGVNLGKKEDTRHAKYENNKLNSTENHKEALRSSCWKEAYESCKKSCKATLRYICDDYMCSKDMKKYFKHECKSNCKYRLRD